MSSINSAIKVKVAIIGISGYTGEELLKILIRHPYVEISFVVGNSTAGKKLSDLYTLVPKKIDLIIQSIENVDFNSVGLVFLCLPHTQSQSIAANLPEQIKVIDLSADFRLNVELYERYYGTKHLATLIQPNFVYGLSEINRDQIQMADYIACPGCYPTSVLIPLIPLVEFGWIDPDNIFIDSKSGISGAGKVPSDNNIFCHVNENLMPYKIGCHRHIPEIELNLTNRCTQEVSVEFVPQIIPVTRGMSSTIFVKSKYSFDQMKSFLYEYYIESIFVELVEYIPTIKDVVNTNYLLFTVLPGRKSDSVIIVSVIDNLLKGASGQAVQNMNLMFGWGEGLALDYI